MLTLKGGALGEARLQQAVILVEAVTGDTEQHSARVNCIEMHEVVAFLVPEAAISFLGALTPL